MISRGLCPAINSKRNLPSYPSPLNPAYSGKILGVCGGGGGVCVSKIYTCMWSMNMGHSCQR